MSTLPLRNGLDQTFLLILNIALWAWAAARLDSSIFHNNTIIYVRVYELFFSKHTAIYPSRQFGGGGGKINPPYASILILPSEKELETITFVV